MGADMTAIRAGFDWRVPEDFSIPNAICDSWAAIDPARTAIIDRSDGQRRVWTYGDLKSTSDRLAGAFRAAGVRKGDRVAILLPQCAEVMVTHIAAMKCGAIVLPLFTLFGEDALSFRLNDAGARLVVTDGQNLDKLMSVKPACPDLTHVISLGGARGEVLDWSDAVRAKPAVPEPVGAEDPAVLIYTSGTTGSPKGALHAHRFLIGHLPSVEMVLGRLPLPGDVGWTPADWAWIGGLMDLAMPCLYFGVPLVAERLRKFTPEAAFQLIAEEGVTVAFLPPTALKMMRGAKVPSDARLRAIGSGGESLGADLLAWGREQLGAPINELYGQTECNLVVSSAADLGVLRPGTMGQAVPGHNVAILDAAGMPVPNGTVGEICVKGPDPVMFLRYWNQPNKTEEKFIGPWLRTGDLGQRDSDGYLTYVSRDDDIITSAGYRIGPTEIENCLSGHEDVLNAAAVGLPDPVRTEVVTAFVVLREGVAGTSTLAEALVQRVRDRISPHVAPREVRFVESLPMTATGKVMRRSLRDSSL